MESPEILHGVKAIAMWLGCSSRRVRGLVRAGAPILVTGTGDGRRYLASTQELRRWLAGRSDDLGAPGGS